MKHVNTSPYYPCPNLVERINNNAKLALSMFHSVDQRSWDDDLPELNLALNSISHSATGFSPNKVFFGRELPLAILSVWVIPPESLETMTGKELENCRCQTGINLETARKTFEKKCKT
ncbi:hypothetical protein PR048_011862 [Dryococelus australis]|uniref:Integrase catalytic domain-containing protein n=1 Tax=Dryococelus australis TaxID=614101 RepID=A0ABQ9HMU5_9NEOP|nr:hypothetical protein PR048_011862 [Dryococelus australis]